MHKEPGSLDSLPGKWLGGSREELWSGTMGSINLVKALVTVRVLNYKFNISVCAFKYAQAC